MLIPFSKPPATVRGAQYVLDVLNSGATSGDHKYTKLCHNWLEKKINTQKALLTTSGTHSLELASLLCNLEPNDEIILPSFTFSSTANAFLLRGCRLIFIDIRPDTMNMNEKLIESAISTKTKAIVPVHYAGVGCEMDSILAIAKQYKLSIIEDAAQAILSKYKGKYLGTFGDFGAISFHETKNITCGEGGALFINNEQYIRRAEIIREKGTNRAEFFRGEVDKYSWKDIGSSYLPSDINASYLYSQLEMGEEITENRMVSWRYYFNELSDLANKGFLELPSIPEFSEHNAHIFFVKVRDLEVRSKIIQFLREKGIMATFHYVPLHSTPIGRQNGEFIGEDYFTTKESERILRLPLYYQMSMDKETSYVVEMIHKFYS